MRNTPTNDFEPTMTDDEALMWRIGADPWLDPSGSLLAVLDRPVDLDLLRRKVAAGIPSMPRLVERVVDTCLLYTSPSPRDGLLSRMPSSA